MDQSFLASNIMFNMTIHHFLPSLGIFLSEEAQLRIFISKQEFQGLLYGFKCNWKHRNQ